MALNPFFLQGSPGEQNLMQQLIDEQLKIYGVEITYIPRKIVNRSTVFEELERSKFDDNFLLEAYVETWDGYGGQGDIMTKFGMTLKDELTISISRERFEDFISPFMESMPDDEILIATRPREGDLVYFPLGGRLFEVKFVEHEDPFYQLGKNYVYQLKCELFELEDEVIDTSIEAIDTQVKDEGYITTLKLVGLGRTAIATASIGSGYVEEIFLNNDGSGFTSPPTITFSDSPANDTTRAIGIMTTRANVTSIEKILVLNAGSGYVTPPTISFSGGGGTGAAATCSIGSGYNGVVRVNVIDGGVGYGTAPTVTISAPGNGVQATGISSVGPSGQNRIVKFVYVDNPGKGYTSTPTVTIADPESMVGVGTYQYNETIKGTRSGTTATVRSWDGDTKILLVTNVGIGSTIAGFFSGEDIVGQISGATYSTASYDSDDANDKYSDGDEFEFQADQIIDFTESNPFGVV